MTLGPKTYSYDFQRRRGPPGGPPAYLVGPENRCKLPAGGTVCIAWPQPCLCC